MKIYFKPKITLFHCINTFSDDSLLPVSGQDMFELKAVKMPCSSMVKDVFLLRAFEAGADAVIVFVCPEGACRYLEGNIRAKKRINRVKNLLDEIGLDGRRLSLCNISHGDETLASKVFEETLANLENLGPNPAA
jgi:coenzyme F420-reducing hydrogenase delta subunit